MGRFFEWGNGIAFCDDIAVSKASGDKVLGTSGAKFSTNTRIQVTTMELRQLCCFQLIFFPLERVSHPLF